MQLAINMTSDVTSSLTAFQLLQPHFNPFAEEIWVVALNSMLQVQGLEMVFRGTADHCLIHPRDIFRYLIKKNASSFILAHNHPSTEVLPSPQDLIITRKLYNCGKMMQIPLQDHIVFAHDKYFSIADQGYFKSFKKGYRPERYY